jgi:hypothetical protein
MIKHGTFFDAAHSKTIASDEILVSSNGSSSPSMVATPLLCSPDSICISNVWGTISGLELFTITKQDSSVCPNFLWFSGSSPLLFSPLTGSATGLQLPKEKGQTGFGACIIHALFREG